MWIIESCAPTKEEKIILEIVLDYSILFYDKWYTCIQPLCRAPNQYTVKVIARDQAFTPRESQEATVVINVLKNRFAPQARIDPNPIDIGKYSCRL